MNISTLAKILGVSINDLRETGTKKSIFGFAGRNTRIPYNSALEITKILRPEKAAKLQNDDKIYLPATLTVGEFAEAISRPAGIIVKTLLLNGVMATLNEKIDYDTASLIAEELRIEVFPENGELFDNTKQDNMQMVKSVEYDTPEDEKVFVTRPPIVTIMGHVDHGKTTLLDTIRKTNVVATEAGAITQHISSYQITYKDQKITFVDTPGHEAFTAMRARGTQIADFIILLVSAVEGAKPQTVEVIERAKLSKTPVIVAINKIDLPESDVERVKQDIAKFGLVPEEWGGDVPFIPISARNNLNIDKLLDTILLHAEVATLKGQVECPGQAVIIESNLDRQMGVIASILVTKDKLEVGNFIRCGEYVGKIRKLEDSNGKSISQALVSEPVVLVGLPEVVEVGEVIIVYPNQKEAQLAASLEVAKRVNKRGNTAGKHNQTDDNQINLVLKADVSGSLEALKESIIKIPQDKVKLVIKQESVGEVSEGDVEFAHTTGSTILAFHTKVSQKGTQMMKNNPVNVVQSDIIYEILQWIEESILKQIKYEVKITVLGKAEVLAVFKSEKASVQVFGGEVKEGKIFSNKNLRVMRGEEEIGILEVQELQRNKSKVSEANISQQFGMSVTGKGKIQVGDIIESIDETVVK